MIMQTIENYMDPLHAQEARHWQLLINKKNVLRKINFNHKMYDNANNRKSYGPASCSGGEALTVTN